MISSLKAHKILLMLQCKDIYELDFIKTINHIFKNDYNFMFIYLKDKVHGL